MKMFRVVVNGNEYKVGVEELVEEKVPRQAAVMASPAPSPSLTRPAAPPAQARAPEPAAAQGGRITAPMPGTILRVAVSAGERATKGQTLLVLEAMKMENEILAPSDCLITEIAVSQGASVNVGDTLVVMAS